MTILVVLGIIFLGTILIGTPVSFCIGMTAMVACMYDPSLPQTTIVTKLITGIDTFPLLAGAFFIIAGDLMSRGSITKKLIAFSKLIIGKIRGGTAMASVIASVFFAGISGAAVADLAAIGSFLTPAMKEEGYDDEFSTVVPVAASVVGPIIPPSVIMVIYAMSTNGSVAALFLGGILPGVLMGIGLLGMVYYYSVKRNYPKNEDAIPRGKEFVKILLRAIPVLLMPIIIIVGVLGGVFTATESGNIALVYAFILSVVFYREYKFKDIYKIFVNSAVTISISMLVISTASSLSYILAANQVPQAILKIITSVTGSPLMFLFLLNVLLLLCGMFLDPGAAIILLAPVLMPLGSYYGIHPLHMAMVVCLNLTLGVVTPPVGVCLYVGAGIGRVSIDRVVKGILPFVALEFAVVLLVTYFPEISTAIPMLFGYV